MSCEDGSHKLLICGDVNGKIKALCARVASVTKSAGNFDMMFCVGKFFGDDLSEIRSFFENGEKLPVPTYVLASLPEELREFDAEHNQNLSFLGSRGIYTTVSGLRIVYISSVDEQSDSLENSSDSLLSSTLAAEDIGFVGVDILLTSQWPLGVERHSMFPLPADCSDCVLNGSVSISKLAYFLRPRYHFSSGNGCYYERAPYRNHRVLQEKASHVTRFIALADVKNRHNRKYLYALKLMPIDKMSRSDLTNQPADVTENPYRDTMELLDPSHGKETEVQTEQYFYSTQSNESSSKRSRKRMSNDHASENNGKSEPEAGDNDASSEQPIASRKRRAETLAEKLDKPREQAACWFCLGNPQVKKHLIVSVNTQAYLALPRGPLVTDHVLILTVGHHRSWTACPDYVRSEIEDYKARLKRMFSDQGKAVVAFERNLKTQHYQLQVIPIPFSVAGEVKSAFMDLSARCPTSPCALQPIPRHAELSEICAPGLPYFYVELPTGERLFGQIKKDRIATSDIQFGRLVLCDSRILDCPDRADWRNCTDDEDEEARLTLDMRERFAPYEND